MRAINPSAVTTLRAACPGQSAEDDVHADVYIRDDAPIALVFWRTNETRPFLSLRDFGDGKLHPFTLIANDDVPAHDQRRSFLHVRLETYRNDEDVLAVALSGGEGREPTLIVAGDSIAAGFDVEPQQPYDGNDMDAAIAYSRQINGLFGAGKREEAYLLWRRDPNGGANRDFAHYTQQDFEVAMFSMKDIYGKPTFEQPQGYKVGGFTVGHQAKLGETGPWGVIRHVAFYDGKPYLTVEFPEPVVIDGDKPTDCVTVHFGRIADTRMLALHSGVVAEAATPELRAGDDLINRSSQREHYITAIVDGKIYHTDGKEEFVHTPEQVLEMCTVPRFEKELSPSSATASNWIDAKEVRPGAGMSFDSF